MRYAIGKVIAMAAMLGISAWVMSPSVFALETSAPGQGDAMTAAPPTSTDIKKESPERSSSNVSDGQIASELSKDLEQPMSVPDSESLPAMPDRRPLCGPWKNAINHVYCAPGYDVY